MPRCGVVSRLRAYYRELTIPVDEEGAEISSGEIAARYRRALLEVVQVQKKEVIKSRREGGFDYEVTRELELELEEARLLRTRG